MPILLESVKKYEKCRYKFIHVPKKSMSVSEQIGTKLKLLDNFL